MRPMPFDKFSAEVLSMYKPPMRAKGTYRQMAQVLREFAELPQVQTVRDLKATSVSAWFQAHPDRTEARSASLLRSLSPAVRYAMSERHIKVSPFSFRKVTEWAQTQSRAPDRPQPPRHKSADSIDRLLRLLDSEAAGGAWKAGRLQALVYLLAFTGLRKGEALNLMVHDVELSDRTIVIQYRRTFRPKTKKSAARIPIAEPLADVLGLWLPRTGCRWVFPGAEQVGPWTGGCPGYKALDEVRAAGERAGIDGLTIAGFRKTIGTLAKSWGLGQLEVKALLRHSNVETQRWYDEEQVESLRPAVARIQFGPTRARA